MLDSALPYDYVKGASLSYFLQVYIIQLVNYTCEQVMLLKATKQKEPCVCSFHQNYMAVI